MAKHRKITLQTLLKLPPPQMGLDVPLMTAIAQRRTRRKWKNENLTIQEIANILWVACGITMEQTKKSKCRRTTPSSRNSQAIKVYVATDQGVFQYLEQEHELSEIINKDIRSELGTQKMMHSMPVGLIYIADYSKYNAYTAKDEARMKYIAGTETGFISQNVYLYCAATGLNTAILGLVDRTSSHALLGLQPHEKVIYTQAIGKNPD